MTVQSKGYEPQEEYATISTGYVCDCRTKIESMRWNFCPVCGIKFDWTNNKSYQAAVNRID